MRKHCSIDADKPNTHTNIIACTKRKKVHTVRSIGTQSHIWKLELGIGEQYSLIVWILVASLSSRSSARGGRSSRSRSPERSCTSSIR